MVSVGRYYHADDSCATIQVGKPRVICPCRVRIAFQTITLPFYFTSKPWLAVNTKSRKGFTKATATNPKSSCVALLPLVVSLSNHDPSARPSTSSGRAVRQFNCSPALAGISAGAVASVIEQLMTAGALTTPKHRVALKGRTSHFSVHCGLSGAAPTSVA